MLILESHHIEHTIGDRLLFAFDRLSVGKHDRIGVVGLNGTGKTTLLRILAGQLEPDKGTVTTTVTRTFIPQLKPDIGFLSGGEVTARYIDEALAARSELLFADEPTMHLDVERIERLEERFRQYQGAIVVVSHDRAFLDRICSRIWAVEDRTVRVYKGGYSDYETQRELEKRQHHERYEAYVDKRRQLEEAVALKNGKASGMMKPPNGVGPSEARGGKDFRGSTQKGVHKSIKALETRIEKLERVEKPRELPRVKMQLPNEAALHKLTAIRVERLTAKAGERTLWSNVSFALQAGRKAALIGSNGSGKTTLLKRILSREAGVSIASAVKPGYFSQNLDILNPAKSVLANAAETAVQSDAVVRNVLARLLFTRDDVYKPVGVLSGGERVKAAFAKLFVSDINLLILDEPTNFLDIPSIEALEQLLRDYEGTLLFVSHDRRLIRGAANQILHITDGRIVSYDGTYADYEDHLLRAAQAGAPDLEEELMMTETKLSEVLGKLGMPGPADDPDMLDRLFRQLASRRSELKKLLGRK
ncbi:MAG TPA: ABC-F family ATP-binding cassette domain-containing protein [Paenibacillus sp.]|uniref:ribosomal protection-like ABC-F family protein n=1 Tax=Paenibacillus sp. TaxID=58172 RepID=UPI002CD17E8A|nr:ABC-F family ATP-binding cassette domain-containing protein [Paenibacillus sp.]HUC92724.1 ABC-F family ATP-binding cassette domain-containing protein [Paenibacillus sp.]